MKQERKFRFVGNPDEYTVIKKGEIVPFGFHPKEWDAPVQDYSEKYPKDWEIVEDEPTWIFEPANQDQPASSMTKFEMAVFMVLQGMVANSDFMSDYEAKSSNAINQVQETFKQLENLKK